MPDLCSLSSLIINRTLLLSKISLSLNVANYLLPVYDSSLDVVIGVLMQLKLLTCIVYTFEVFWRSLFLIQFCIIGCLGFSGHFLFQTMLYWMNILYISLFICVKFSLSYVSMWVRLLCAKQFLFPFPLYSLWLEYIPWCLLQLLAGYHVTGFWPVECVEVIHDFSSPGSWKLPIGDPPVLLYLPLLSGQMQWRT